jgi:transmembrane sensor
MDDILLIDYIKGDLSKIDAEKVKAWINESEENKTYFESLKQIWSSQTPSITNPNTDFAWGRLQNRLDEKRRSQMLKWKVIAAAVFPILTASLWLLLINLNGTITYSRGAGENTTAIELPDGSKVWLNRDTKLELSENFDLEERKVKLSGEAFFEVKKDQSKPFIIETENIITTVLGTSFNVMAYADSLTTRVDVATGKVKVNSIDNLRIEALLTKNMAAQFDVRGNEMKTISQLNENSFAWKTRRLSFENAGINEIKSLVKKVYNVDLIFNVDQECIQFNAAFDNEPVINILNAINSLYDISYREISKNLYQFEGTCNLNSK